MDKINNKIMQSTKANLYNSSSSLQSYANFTAWQHLQPPEVSLKFLNSHLSYLQKQYKTILKEKNPLRNLQNSLFAHKKSLSKVPSVQQSQIRLPEVKVFRKEKSIAFSKGKENVTSKGGQKTVVTRAQQQKIQEKKRLQKRRSGSQFSQLKDYFKGDVDQKVIFLRKNQLSSNISKTLNLKTIKRENSHSLKHQPLQKSKFLVFNSKISRNSLGRP